MFLHSYLIKIDNLATYIFCIATIIIYNGKLNKYNSIALSSTFNYVIDNLVPYLFSVTTWVIKREQVMKDKPKFVRWVYVVWGGYYSVSGGV